MSVQWTTISEIKTAGVSRIALGVAALKEELTKYAQTHHGSFVIYGSVARGNFRFDSDVDVLVDFPPEAVSEAWRFCEDACRKHGLVPDVQPKYLCSPKFLQRLSTGAMETCGERSSLA
jgi:Nucleotidyltransferase domain